MACVARWGPSGGGECGVLGEDGPVGGEFEEEGCGGGGGAEGGEEGEGYGDEEGGLFGWVYAVFVFGASDCGGDGGGEDGNGEEG